MNDKEQIEAEAAEWVIRLGADTSSDQDHHAFELWRSQSLRHAQAFHFAQQTWGALAALRDAPGSLAADMRQPTVRRTAPRGNRQGRRLRLAAGVAMTCLVAAIGMTSFWYGNPLTLMAADYRTAPGEQQTVTLPDGSVVELASGSAIALHFSKDERRVELLAGAAYFTAVSMGGQEPRPFVVEGAGGTATALGTQFLVDRLPEAVEVVVAEHEVRVALIDRDGPGGAITLSPGQSVRYSSQSGLGEISAKNVDQATAWRRGRLVFDQVSLADVVAELNRYRRGRIVIANAALASRQVSGVFETRDLNRALDTIARELGLRSTSLPALVTVLY
ncbi:FecR domain-containing protein [Shinella curvata]|uniref:FecR domain-containing protein n=1 Tax=Shinella curvata TaxID=1817964 RepID=A0ABT8XM30_9HYPH|nr:FecR domain-containing protein [Shinella curvata]MCJ8055781.1 FecR domain-containing protein [Shinella curvata]MDO6124797.1 FecR domain-containing protein [Shinella curvata]